MTMGDRVAVLKDGLLQQVDTPRNLYDNPANAFVAGFIGSPAMNLLIAPVSGGKAKLGGLDVDVPSSAGSSVIVGVRPEGFTPSSKGFEVQVEVVEELGADAFVYGKPVDATLKFANASDEGAQVIIRWDPKNPPKSGEKVTVSAKGESVHLFNVADGKRIK
jgi:multiple sugar transport system ATP-binding protein